MVVAAHKVWKRRLMKHHSGFTASILRLCRAFSKGLHG